MRIHLIAIGGAVMHNLALALQKAGHSVQGSDDEIFEPSLSRLAAKGLLPEEQGWFPERLHNHPDAVILGMHARQDNPELLEAQKLGLPIYSFPEFIYEQSKNAIRVAICGSHGKTTITSMVMHVLRREGMHFDYLVGAQLDGFETMVQVSDAPVMIIEGDEYFASPIDKRPKFLLYKPHIVLISGIAWDHYNVFPTFDVYVDTFRSLLQSMEPQGTCYYYGGDTEMQKLIRSGICKATQIPYATPAYRSVPNGTLLTVAEQEFTFPVIGKHNMENMQGAKHICTQLGVSEIAFYTHMQTFTGAAKRMQIMLSSDDHTIYRDFAHAPSKVKATVSAIKEQFPDKKLTACLELHTYSSLNMEFIPQYAGAMMQADHRIVYFNPHALALKKLPPLDPGEIREALQDPELIVTDNTETLKKELQKVNNVNTHIVLMSSGNYDNLDFGFLT